MGKSRETDPYKCFKSLNLPEKNDEEEEDGEEGDEGPGEHLLLLLAPAAAAAVVAAADVSLSVLLGWAHHHLHFSAAAVQVDRKNGGLQVTVAALTGMPYCSPLSNNT